VQLDSERGAGEFGNYHATKRTSGSDLFINPLMSQYWTFENHRVAHHMADAGELMKTERTEDARLVIERWRETTELRPRQPIPL
jgi:hypothetical protein